MSYVEFLEPLLKSCDRFEGIDELAEFCPVKVGGGEEGDGDLRFSKGKASPTIADVLRLGGQSVSQSVKITNMEYVFEWDPNKARLNQTKHDISFRQASQVFKDTVMMTVFDDEHNFEEDRWITVGLVGRGLYLLVIHTFDEINPAKANVRIISARRASRSEIDQYQGG